MKTNKNSSESKEAQNPELNSGSSITLLPPLSTLELWNGMQYYYDMGLSMIWSRVETEIVNGIERTPKTPVGRWKAAQVNRFTLKELNRVMHGSAVQIAPTIVCGQVLESIELHLEDIIFFIGG